MSPTAQDDAISIAMTPALEAETEMLLAQRTRDIRFSPEMAAAYRIKTWRQRSKIARSWMVWVGLISMAFVPISFLLAPASIWSTAIISGLLVPTLHACAYPVWRKPRSAAVEGLSLIVLMSSVMIAYGALAVAVGGRNYELFLIYILYVNTIAIVVFNVEYVWSIALMISSMAIFAGFEVCNPEINIEEAMGTLVFYTVAIYAVTVARKTQFLFGQKAFLMLMRDRYRSEALTAANQQLEVLATRDPLTGLGNRRSAAELIDRLWNDRGTAKASIAFVMADLDSFKRLNDTAGHAAGDECIRRSAEAIERSVRAGYDAVFRYGGEEFLIVLTNATPDLAWTLAERVRCAVEALGIVNPGIDKAAGIGGVVTISLGVAFARDEAAPELVAKWADDALYDAKHSGRNLVFLSTAQSDNRRCGQSVAAVQPGNSASPSKAARMMA